MSDSDSITALNRWPYVDPRPEPLPAPSKAWNEEPCRCIVLNAEWATHLLGVIDRLLEPDAWSGTDAEKFAAQQAMEEIQAQLSIPCDITGPAGPQGLPGIQGPQGPVGAAGPGVEMRTINGCTIQWRVVGGTWISLLDVCDLIQPSSEGGSSSSCSASGSSSGDSEEGDMGQVVTDVQIVNGKIRVFFGPCCYKDLGSAFDLIDTTDKTKGLPESLQPENTAKDVKCQKAYMIAWHLWNMANLTFQAPSQNLYSDLMSYYPSISFDRKDLASVYFSWAMLTGPLQSGLFDITSGDFKRYVCSLRGAFDATWAISSDEFKAMKSVLGGSVSLLQEGLLAGIIDAVGPGDWNNLALDSSLQVTDYDCECPGRGTPIFQPLPTSWYLGEWSDELSLINTSNSGVFDTAYIDNYELAEDCFGWALIVTSRTSGRATGCEPGDIGLSTGSSPIVKGGTVFSTIPGTIQLTCGQAAFASIAAANPSVALYWAGEEDISSSDFSSDPANPTFAAGAFIVWTFRNQWEEATNLTFRVAPLYNAASLSHQI